jgi:hypothetical protein
MLVFMNAPVLLGIIAVVFGIAPIILRSNAVYIFLSLCASDQLARLAGGDITNIVSSLVSSNLPMYSVVQIVLLVAAPLVLLFMFKKGVKSSKMILQIVPAAAAVLVGFMLVVSKLPYDLEQKIHNSSIYNLTEPFFELAIAAGLLFSVLYFWTKRPKPKDEDKKGHK